jgi:hypothetical protein
MVWVASVVTMTGCRPVPGRGWVRSLRMVQAASLREVGMPWRRASACSARAVSVRVAHLSWSWSTRRVTALAPSV